MPDLQPQIPQRMQYGFQEPLFGRANVPVEYDQ